MSWIWVVVALVAIAIIIAVVLAANRTKREHHRRRAGELREEAAAQSTDLQRHEAEAREREAEAARVRAEADRLEADARDRAAVASEHRQEHHEKLRRADEMDPAVDTRSDAYVGPTDDGTGHSEYRPEIEEDRADVTADDYQTGTEYDERRTGEPVSDTSVRQDPGTHRA